MKCFHVDCNLAYKSVRETLTIERKKDFIILFVYRSIIFL